MRKPSACFSARERHPEGSTIPYSLFPIEEQATEDRRDFAHRAARIHRHAVGTNTSPASHRRPPAIIGPRRALDSCGVGAFSLNYGPQTARGKSPYVPGPCCRAPSPRRATSTIPPYGTSFSDICAAPFAEGGAAASAISVSLGARIRTALTRVTQRRTPAGPVTVASCNSVCESRDPWNTRIVCFAVDGLLRIRRDAATKQSRPRFAHAW